MDVKTYTAYTEDSMLRLPLAHLALRFLRVPDSFLDRVERDFPDVTAELVDRLTTHLKAETSNDLPLVSAEIAAVQQSTCRHAERFPDLYTAHTDLVRSLLGVDDVTFLHGEHVELSQRRFVRTRYLPRYLMLVALSETVGRRHAMALMRQVLDQAIAELPARPDAPNTLEELRTQQIEFNLAEQGMDWVQGIVGPYQYLNRVTRCRIQHVLSAYDSELMEVVACYPDFAMFRHTNPHFALTRTMTLMNGGACCDSCYHDDRHVESFGHPEKTVFDQLG